MEAPGLLRLCSNQEAALATLSINPYSSIKILLNIGIFLVYIVFLDYRSITRSKYAKLYQFSTISLNFLFHT